MHFPYFIAKRYLFSKKSHNAINIISGISILGVTIGTIALIVILSVFNGLDGLVKSLMNSFDPEIKITAVTGKTFVPDSLKLLKISQIKNVSNLSEIVEETALLEFSEKQTIVTAKGVPASYADVTGIDTSMVQGNFILKQNQASLAVVGYGIAYNLSLGLNGTEPMKVFFPNRDFHVGQNPEEAFNSRLIFPSGFFSIQNEFDSKYVLLPIDFVRELLNYTKEVTSLEVKLFESSDEKLVDNAQSQIRQILGNGFRVENRREQNALINKTMKSEKWAIFLILTFILLVASFNVVGSLTMLIIDKKSDILTLQALGASQRQIHQIFFSEGWVISLLGAFLGLIIGSLICWVQIKFGVVSFPNSSIISSYPVKIIFSDYFLVFFTVAAIGFLAAWFPVRYITKKYIHV